MKSQKTTNPSIFRLFCLYLLAAAFLPMVFANTAGASNRGQTILISVPDNNPTVFLDEDQQNPYVISLPDKGIWFVVWEDWRNWNTSGSDIYGRFINADGAFCGNEVLITNSAGNQTVPRIAYRNGGPQSPSTDQLMVVWQDTRGDDTGGYVYYKTMDLTGMGGTCAVNSNVAETPVGYNSVFGETLRSRYLPKISYDEDRDIFWIVWVEGRSAIQHIWGKPFYHMGYNNNYSWSFEDTTSAAFFRVKGGTLTTDNEAFGTNPDTIRSDDGISFVKVNGLLTMDKENRALILNNRSTIDMDDILAINGVPTVIPSDLSIKLDNSITIEQGTTLEMANTSAVEITIGNNTFVTSTRNIDDPVNFDFPDNTKILELLPFVSVDNNSTEDIFEDDIIKISEEGSVFIKKGSDLVVELKGPVNFTRRNNSIDLDLGIDADGVDSGGFQVTMYEPISLDSGNNITITGAASVNLTTEGGAFARYDGTTTAVLRAILVTAVNGAPLSPGLHTFNIAIGLNSLKNGDELTLRSGRFTIRKLASSFSVSGNVFTVVEVMEYFTGVNNVNVASDASSPETLITWEGTRYSLTVTSVLNLDENTFGTDFKTDAEPADGQNHIYAIFDKNIKMRSINSLRLDTGSPLSSYYSSVEADPIHRKFLVAWEDHRESVNSKIYGQLVYTGGEHYKSNFIISFQDFDGDGANDNSVMSSEQTRPHVSYDTANQRFFVTWQDGRNSTMSLENLDIYGQYVESEATSRGNNFAITSAPANQLNPITSFNNANHMFLTVWKDARNINDTNSDIFGLPFTLDFGVPLDFTPTSIDFGKLLAGTTKSETIEFTNGTISNVTINSIVTGSDLYTVSGIAPGTTVTPGSTVTATVTFLPQNKGSYEDGITVTLGPETFVLNIPLTGTAALEGEGGEIPEPTVTETTSADAAHPISVNVKTEETGRIYILQLHDPLDNNNISALLPGDGWVHFPSDTADGWQNHSYMDASPDAEPLTIGTADLRGRPGVLHTAVFVKDPNDEPAPFDFTTGLLDHRRLVVRNSPGGTWIVTDTMVNTAGETQVFKHPDPLVIVDNVSHVSVSWGSYNPTIQYLAGIGYKVVFSAAGQTFTYTLGTFTPNNFTGVLERTVGNQISAPTPVTGTRSGF